MKSLAGKFVVAANWKMNKTPQESMEFIKTFKSLFHSKDGREILFFPPYLSLPNFKQEFDKTPIRFGAQNCHFEEQGAFTGEVSARMLAAYGVGYCLVGHSERRTLFGETDEMISKKVLSLQKNGVLPMICIGETEKEKRSGLTLSRIESQLEQAVSLSTGEVVFAYEPVWAIGTGMVPQVDDISEVHGFIRSWLKKHLGDSVGGSTPILYGGSVNEKNAAEIAEANEVGGFLIGGASLKPDTLVNIYNF